MTEVSDFARKQAADLGLIEEFDDLEELLLYIEQSAIITHELGNRRYGSCVFFIDSDDVVQSVNALGNVCRDCKGTKKQAMFEVCEVCDGEGCRSCLDYGGYQTFITCQTCKD